MLHNVASSSPILITYAGSLDGHDLNRPQELGPELLPIGTGQRYDLVFRMPSSGQVRLFDMRPQLGASAVRKVRIPEKEMK